MNPLPENATDAEVDAWEAERLAPIYAIAANRTALADALALADLYPAPTPEETAIIDAQVNAALDSFMELENPPSDIVALAAAIVSWRVRL